MKTIQVPKPIRNVDGLLAELKKADPPFGVVSVGTDPRSTYIYLEDHEDRDPAPIVQAWVDDPELKAIATGQVGIQGVAEALANGVDVHTILIQKVDPAGNVVPGAEKLTISAPPGIPVSDSAPKLSEGMVMIQVGPSQKTGDFSVMVSDRSGKLKKAVLPLRFVAKQTPVEPEEKPTIETKGGVMAAIRRWLGI